MHLHPMHVHVLSPHDLSAHHPHHRGTLDPTAVGHPAGALRRDVPGRAGRVDGRRRPAVHRFRTGPLHLDAAMDRQRLHPGIRRTAPPRRPHRRPAGPPPGLPGGPGRLRARLAARRTRRLGPAADRQPLHQGPERGVHRPGGPVDHHHDLRRGPPAQSRPVDLHDLRGHRLLHGPRTVRPAHRGQLAPHHAAARAHRAARPARRPEAAAAQRTREGPQRLRHPRRRPRHGLDAAAGVHRRPGPRGRLGLDPYPPVLPRRGRPAHRLRPCRAALARAADPARRAPLRQSDPRPARRDGVLRLVRRIPVPGDAVHAVAARLVGPAHRARLPARSTRWSRSPPRRSAPSSTASGRRASSRWASC